MMNGVGHKPKKQIKSKNNKLMIPANDPSMAEELRQGSQHISNFTTLAQTKQAVSKSTEKI
jgi:hypothetical protein